MNVLLFIVLFLCPVAAGKLEGLCCYCNRTPNKSCGVCGVCRTIQALLYCLRTSGGNLGPHENRSLSCSGQRCSYDTEKVSLSFVAMRLCDGKDFPSMSVEFSLLILIFFTPFLVRKCQSKDNHKSSKLFSDESPCCQLNTWLHLHRKQLRKPPGRVGLELLEPLWLLPVWGWACAAVPAGSSCFPSLAPPAQSCHSE